MYIEVESMGWWVAMKWRVTAKLCNFQGEMALKQCTQNVTNIDKPYIMNKSDGDFQQGGCVYKPNSVIMDTQVLMDIWEVSEKQTSQLLAVVFQG